MPRIFHLCHLLLFEQGQRRQSYAILTLAMEMG